MKEIDAIDFASIAMKVAREMGAEDMRDGETCRCGHAPKLHAKSDLGHLVDCLGTHEGGRLWKIAARNPK
jgi:hypothetical protein